MSAGLFVLILFATSGPLEATSVINAMVAVPGFTSLATCQEAGKAAISPVQKGPYKKAAFSCIQVK